mmetsp:Transcript_60488/g.160826  ORF Transcript_60488/g.160826 Transcript_60488/m.160826 type:complete len:209 (+) Transcript_60488:210-836(+)
MLQHWQDALDGRNLLVVNENQRIRELDFLCFGVCDEVGRDETSVKSHALNDLQLVLHSFALRNGDSSFLTDSLESVRNHLADGRVAIRRDRRDLENLFWFRDGLGTGLQVFQYHLDGSVNAPLQVHGIHACRHCLGSLTEDRARKYRGSRGAITCKIVRLRRHLLDELGPHILHPVLELNGFGHSDTILRDLRRTVALFDHHIPALGP